MHALSNSLQMIAVARSGLIEESVSVVSRTTLQAPRAKGCLLDILKLRGECSWSSVTTDAVATHKLCLLVITAVPCGESVAPYAIGISSPLTRAVKRTNCGATPRKTTLHGVGVASLAW